MSDSEVDLWERAYKDTVTHVHAPYFLYSSPDDYKFGKRGLRLPELAALVPESGKRPPVVLDVGAGKGDFLAAFKSRRTSIRAIGLTVVAHSHQVDADISWVYGDLLRPDTWRPRNALTWGSVDLSVSRLTYHWLANPVRGLQINHRLLRRGGHMFVQNVEIKLEPRTSKRATELIVSQLRRNAGEHNTEQPNLQKTNRLQHTLILDAVHLRGGKPMDFSGLHLTEDGLLHLHQPD